MAKAGSNQQSHNVMARCFDEASVRLNSNADVHTRKVMQYNFNGANNKTSAHLKSPDVSQLAINFF